MEPARSRRNASFHESSRALMVRNQLVARGITDVRVLDAMARVPREEFVPAPVRPKAYDDGPLPLSGGQTISQPFVVARMTEALKLSPGNRVLDVGTGSGYQAVVLASMGVQVYSVERDHTLYQRARETLDRLGHEAVQLRHGDGRQGWPSAAPFAAILVAAVADAPPADLLGQLQDGGRMVMPLRMADGEEMLVLIHRQAEQYHHEQLLPVRFVPLQPGLA